MCGSPGIALHTESHRGRQQTPGHQLTARHRSPPSRRGAGWQAGQSSFHTSIGHLPENALFFVLFSDLYFKIVKFSFSGVSKLTTTSKSQPWQSTLQNIPLPRHGHQDGCYEKGKNNECWQRCGESGTLAALVRMVMVRPPEKQDGGSSKS